MEGVKVVGVLSQNIKFLEMKDKINISSNKELQEDKIFAFKLWII